MDFDEIMNSIIRPFVVGKPYEGTGDFYMSSSSNTNNNEFKIGDRVFFLGKHSIGIFGNIEKVDRDGTRLLVRADDMTLYEVSGSQVTNLSEKNDE